jgi:transposase
VTVNSVRAGNDRRDQLSASRNRIVCRLHNHLRHLRPGGAALHLTAEKASRVLQGIRPDVAACHPSPDG